MSSPVDGMILKSIVGKMMVEAEVETISCTDSIKYIAFTITLAESVELVQS